MNDLQKQKEISQTQRNTRHYNKKNQGQDPHIYNIPSKIHQKVAHTWKMMISTELASASIRRYPQTYKANLSVVYIYAGTIRTNRLHFHTTK